MSLRTTGLEDERQPAIGGHGLEPDLGRQPLGIHRALPLNPRQGRPRRLGLDDPDSLLIDIQQVVSATMTRRHDNLANRHTPARKEVEAPAILDHPASIGQLPVDQNPGALLSRQTIVVRHSPHSPARHDLTLSIGANRLAGFGIQQLAEDERVSDGLVFEAALP